MLHKDELLIAIVDDHPVVVEGLNAVLKKDPGVSTVSFTKGQEIISFLEANNADIVLLDIMLPDINGIDVCSRIKKLRPRTIVLMLSNNAERPVISQALQNGANGYLLKNASGKELLDCIYEALDKNIALDREVKEIMSRPVEKQQVLPRLTKREKQIIGLIADGCTTQQIADAVFISPFTVDTHRRNLLQKLQARNTAELVKIVMEHKLL